MEHIILVGIGDNSVAIMDEAIDDLKHANVIDAVIFDEDGLYDRMADKSVPQKTIEDLPGMTFDKLLVCADSKLSEEATDLFRKSLHLTNRECTSYVKKSIGPHNIRWEDVENSEDILNQIIHSGTMNDLEKFTYCTPHRTIFKWLHYFEVYDRHFAKYRHKAPIVMEIGVYKGGSLQMWKNYFGEGAQIIGIDIDEKTKEFEEEQITIEIGSQEDRDFLQRLKEKYPRIDILIDDGGHTMNQQITTFEEMFPHIAYGGVYLCEDIHTSYLGGRYLCPDSYIEYSKKFIDDIHAWFDTEGAMQENRNSRSMHSLHYYNSILVIEKERIGEPIAIKFNTES